MKRATAPRILRPGFFLILGALLTGLILASEQLTQGYWFRWLDLWNLQITHEKVVVAILVICGIGELLVELEARLERLRRRYPGRA